MAAGRGNHGQFQRLLEMRHLRLISVLGRELNLSRCAEVLHTTQPALSRALAQLEQMIGARLFDRTTRRMSPTSAGLTLIHHADRVLAELDAAETEVRDMPQGVGGELRIGILPSFSAGAAASAIQRTRDLLLGVRIVTHSAPLQSLYADLLQGRLHVVLSHAELPVDLNLVEVVAVYEERVRAVADRSHPLAGRRRLGWDELADYAWVLPPQDSPFRSKLNRVLSVHRRASKERRSDIEANSPNLALHLLARGDTLWALPQQHAMSLIAAGSAVHIPLPEELLVGPMCYMRVRTEQVPASMRLFLGALQDAAAQSEQLIIT
jgi:DNA-binding transcriptional LysR family regulator